MARHTRLNILIAIRPEHQELMAAILKNNELHFVENIEEACAALSTTFDLIICGLHFENGRMYDFLRFSKA
jgi:hypothetical protein